MNNWNFVAAAKATQAVHGVKPDLTREGGTFTCEIAFQPPTHMLSLVGSIPVTLTFQEALKKSVLLLPMGRADDGAHSINEKLDRSNYINGIKLLATYLDEVAKIVVP